MATNSEGLTFYEWIGAAFSGSAHAVLESRADDKAFDRKLRKAWRDGEDPTDWRRWAEDQTP